MTRLTVHPDTSPGPRLDSTDFTVIRAALTEIGVGFERWSAARPLAGGATAEDVLDAYAGEIERLKTEGGYVTVDVVRMLPDHPQRDAIRAKFLAEHTHRDDEVRFFVEGAGLFCLHVGGEVHQLLAEAGDLVRVPAGARHWFDTGPAPFFTAIRLFIDPAGWEARYTGDDIATRFPTYEP